MSTVNLCLKKLCELAPTLNQACAEAARVIRSIETLLARDLNIGVSARATYFKQSKSPNQTIFKDLEFRRVDGKFRFAVVEWLAIDYSDNHNCWKTALEETDVKVWAECPRDVKLASFPSLPDLLAHLMSESEKLAASVQRTNATVEEILAEMNSTEGAAEAEEIVVLEEYNSEFPSEEGSAQNPCERQEGPGKLQHADLDLKRIAESGNAVCAPRPRRRRHK